MTGFAPGPWGPGNENRCKTKVQPVDVYVKPSSGNIIYFGYNSGLSAALAMQRSPRR